MSERVCPGCKRTESQVDAVGDGWGPEFRDWPDCCSALRARRVEVEAERDEALRRAEDRERKYGDLEFAHQELRTCYDLSFARAGTAEREVDALRASLAEAVEIMRGLTSLYSTPRMRAFLARHDGKP